METIESIDDKYEYREHELFLFIGVKVKTSKQEIALIMFGEQSCCEHFDCGIVLPPGIADVKSMEGATIQRTYIGTDWSWTKDNPDAEKPVEGEYMDDENGSVTLHIDTDRGRLKVYAYNYHNGYYPHSYTLTFNGEVHEDNV